MQKALRQLRGSARAFLSWWIGELSAMVPKRIARWLNPTTDRLILELGDAGLVVRHVAGSTEGETGRVDLMEGDEGAERAAVARLLEGIDLAHTAITLRLPAAQALRKVVDLPQAAEENLRQVLAFEMDRQTPFATDDVYFDYHVCEHNPATRRIGVELIVVARSTVDRVLARARGWGIAPDQIDVSTENGKPEHPLNLLPDAGTPAGGRLRRMLTVALGGVAVVLLGAVLYVPLDRRQQAIDQLAGEVATAKAEAEMVRQLQGEIDGLAGQGQFIVERKRTHPTFIEVLNELTRVLPDDTWLFRLRLFENDLQAFGYSSAASTLIGVIEDSPLFRNAQFRAPVTRDPRADAERFHIACQVEREVTR